MPKGENVGLLVQLQAELAEVSFNLFLTVLQILLVRVDEQKVIHVPDIVFDPQSLLHEMVKAIQEQQSQQLRGLIAEG